MNTETVGSPFSLIRQSSESSRAAACSLSVWRSWKRTVLRRTSGNFGFNRKSIHSNEESNRPIWTMQLELFKDNPRHWHLELALNRTQRTPNVPRHKDLYVILPSSNLC